MKTSIEFVFVYPRNLKYVSYIINGNKEIHSMKYDDLYEFIGKLISPKIVMQFKKNLYAFIPMLINIKNNNIIELTLDSEEGILKIKEKILDMTVKTVEKEVKKMKIDNKKEKDKKKIPDIHSFLNKFL